MPKDRFNPDWEDPGEEIATRLHSAVLEILEQRTQPAYGPWG